MNSLKENSSVLGRIKGMVNEKNIATNLWASDEGGQGWLDQH